MLLKRNRITIILLISSLFLGLLTFTSCDPHRSGSVIKGANAKRNYHTKPASSKAYRKKKY